MTEAEFTAFVTTPGGALLVLILAMWGIVWKLLALYRAGANRSKGWFIVLGLVNTLGVLEILYLLIFSRSRTRMINEKLGLNTRI